jgi:predicted secreted protein
MAIDGTSVILLVQQSAGVYLAVGSQTNVQFNRKLSMLDVSDKSSDDKLYIAGERDTDLTLDAFYVPGEVGQALLKQAYLNKAPIVVQRNEQGNPFEHATALISGIDEGFQKAKPGTWKVTLKVSGGWQPGVGP